MGEPNPKPEEEESVSVPQLKQAIRQKAGDVENLKERLQRYVELKKEYDVLSARVERLNLASNAVFQRLAKPRDEASLKEALAVIQADKEYQEEMMGEGEKE